MLEDYRGITVLERKEEEMSRNRLISKTIKTEPKQKTSGNNHKAQVSLVRIREHRTLTGYLVFSWANKVTAWPFPVRRGR